MDLIYHISEICRLSGVQNAIVCPGSRSAPLTISFSKNSGIKTRIILDERSAGYIALGIAQRTQLPVVLICTSGTAALNFAPAVAEAYYQQIPLIIFTADRPPEWIGQAEGQSIQQQDIYGKNIKCTFVLPVDKVHIDSNWAIQRMICEGISRSISLPMGPVHFNVPLREPFYLSKGEELIFKKDLKIITKFESEDTLSKENWDKILSLVRAKSKIIVLFGHQLPSEKVLKAVRSFSKNTKIPILADFNSNLHQIETVLKNYDQILLQNDTLDQELAPDMLISFGNDFLSKRLKSYFKKYKPQIHLQLTDKEVIVDTFQTITHTVKVRPAYFFEELATVTGLKSDKLFYKKWHLCENSIKKSTSNFINESSYTELKAVNEVLSVLPTDSILHCGNSLSVRLASIVTRDRTAHYCNRGTSGIDGCTSTAVGSAIVSTEIVTLISGDVSFLYDRNGLWHKYVPKNIRIVVLNNNGGAIFRSVEGAKDQPELEEYFVAAHNHSAESTARENNIHYFAAHDLEQLQHLLKTFYDDSDHAKLLEVFVNGKETAQTLIALRAKNGLFLQQNT